MPFVVDLPPKPVHELKTKIEYILEDQRLDNAFSSRNALTLDKDLIENSYLKDKFDTLIEEWENNTLFESSILNIIEDDNFQEIINMKEKAIPLIIEEIEKKPSVLVWALNIITDATVETKQRKTIEDICKIWVKYWNEGKIKID